MADHAGPSLAGGADAVWASRLWGNSVPRGGRCLRAPPGNRPDRVSEVDPRTRVVHLLKGHRGCRRVRCGDEPPRLPDRPDPAGSSAERDVGEPATRYDPVVVKAFINLIGIYPVGTCVILDTYEVAIVHSANADVSHVHRPAVRIVTAPDGALLQPGFIADLAQRDEQGNFPRTIVKVTDPAKYGINVSDYFV